MCIHICVCVLQIAKKKKEDFTFDKIIGEGSYSTVSYIYITKISSKLLSQQHKLCYL